MKFRNAILAVIERANSIISEFMAQGFVLTLRQLYYQFVARALIENKQTEYKRLGSIIKDGRRAGLIDWSAIEDRTREVQFHPSWKSPSTIIEAVADQYREDPWRDQLYRPEVWIEKDALLGVIEGVCTEWRVPYFACRGNNSETLQYQAGKRFDRHLADGLIPIVLHLGDHDPNGIDMTRDNRDRLAMFTRHDIEVRRLALNMDQVERYAPPPNFAKETDTRHAAYVRDYGTTECWELDALAPTVIAGLVDAEVEALIDRNAWDAAKRQPHRRAPSGRRRHPGFPHARLQGRQRKMDQETRHQRLANRGHDGRWGY
jgi:hypothetical protein